MIEHLPVLQVVVPLIAAPLCLVLRRAALTHGFAIVVSWTCLAVAIALLQRVLSGSPITYELGGWPPRI